MYNQALLDKAREKYKKALKDLVAVQSAVEGAYKQDSVNRLVCKVKQGDVQAKEELVGLHKDFIKGYVDKFKKVSQCSEDELIETANIGLLKAALDFDEDKGYTFAAYAVWYINRCVIEAVLNIR